MKRLAVGFLLVLAASAFAADEDEGEALFKTHCSVCHGEKAGGTDRGPALVHRVYHPSHHADFSFYLAVQNGVRAHHFSFGDMPPVKGLAKEDIDEVIRYVRGLQREAGIF